MITKNPMQLKAFIKNKAAEKHNVKYVHSWLLTLQVLHQKYLQWGSCAGLSAEESR